MSNAPIASFIPETRKHHTDTVTDGYRWLENKTSPEVFKHLEAENTYTTQRTKHLDVLREQIYEEITAKTQQTDMSVPVRNKKWWYYSRIIEGDQYPLYCRCPVENDTWDPPTLDTYAMQNGLPNEHILFDTNAEAEGHQFFALGSLSTSDDGTYLVWSVDTTGNETYTLRIRHLDNPTSTLDFIVENTAPGAFFDPGSQYVFYTTLDKSWRPETVWRHRVGTAASEDVQVFHESDEKFWVGVGLSRSETFIFIETSCAITSETHFIPTHTPTAPPTCVWDRDEGVEYNVEHTRIGDVDRFLILHNKNAPNFELVMALCSDPKNSAQVLLAHDTAIRLESVHCFQDFTAVEYRREGLTRIAVAHSPHEPSDIDDVLHELSFDETLFTVGVSANPEWNTPYLRIGYSSFITPTTLYDYDVHSHALKFRKQQTVHGMHEAELYQQQRLWAQAHDGTPLPISLVYRKDLVDASTPAPTVLYGYGAYETSIDPTFSIPRLSLLDRGIVFAVAHVRGGGECGRLWYENGKKFHKKNSFTDFIDCAKHLITTGRAKASQLAAEGGSAGGLLIGAVANMAPQYFSGMLANVPFVDTLSTLLNPSLPLTIIEWDEWGDPLRDPEYYHYIKSYSPIDNVHDTHYPPILAITSLNDTRVLYSEPAKWIAKLRSVGADALLKIDMAAGHAGVSGRYKQWQERAFELAWLVDIVDAHQQ